MYTSDKIFIEKEAMEKLKIKLDRIRVTTEDISVKNEILDILKFLDDEINKIKVNNISIQEMIRNKMEETKNSNEELNFKLYMLYRKLQDKKITEEEAIKSYEIYLSQ